MYQNVRINKMNFLSLKPIIVLMSVLAIVLSATPDTYFECEKYSGDQWDQIDQTRRECMREDVDGVDTMFCHHWDCDEPKCPEEEQITWDDGCKACPGWCSEGGKIRAEGTSFTCVDNTNSCSCEVGGGIFQTKMGYNRQLFCNAQ